MKLYACDACGHTVFPSRLLCHRCGGAAWTELPCEHGVVTAVTMPLGEVRTPQDVRVIVRLQQPATPGASVALHEAASGTLWGTSDADQT